MGSGCKVTVCCTAGKDRPDPSCEAAVLCNGGKAEPACACGSPRHAASRALACCTSLLTGRPSGCSALGMRSVTRWLQRLCRTVLPACCKAGAGSPAGASWWSSGACCSGKLVSELSRWHGSSVTGGRLHGAAARCVWEGPEGAAGCAGCCSCDAHTAGSTGATGWSCCSARLLATGSLNSSWDRLCISQAGRCGSGSGTDKALAACACCRAACAWALASAAACRLCRASCRSLLLAAGQDVLFAAVAACTSNGSQA